MELTELPLEYQLARKEAERIFEQKNLRYGFSWLILRPVSCLDLLLIKLYRLRKLEVAKAANLVGEEPLDDALAIVNYAVMAIHSLQRGAHGTWPNLPETPDEEAQVLSATHAIRESAAQLLNKKNHDYDNAWRCFSLATFVDLMLTKVSRCRAIEETGGNNEAEIAELYDIHNYGALLAGKAIVEKQGS